MGRGKQTRSIPRCRGLLFRHGEILLILAYVAAVTWQVNLYPFEVFPGWDTWWVSGLYSRRLVTAWTAVRHCGLPAIDPWSQFGLNWFGEHWGYLGIFQLFMPFCSYRAALWWGQCALNAAGGIGALLYLRHVTGRRVLAFAGAMIFLAIPALHSVCNNYIVSLLVILLVPLFLLLIHRALERPTRGNLAGFAVMSFLCVASGDAWANIFIFPTIAFFYSLGASWRYYNNRFLPSLRKAALLLLLCVVAGAVFYVPYFYSIHFVHEEYAALREAMPELCPPARPWEGALRFVTFFRGESLSSAYAPRVRGGANMYLPSGFYLAILAGLLTAIFRSRSRGSWWAEVGSLVALLVGVGAAAWLLATTSFFADGDFGTVAAMALGLGTSLAALNASYRDERRHAAIVAALFIVGLLMVAEAWFFTSPLCARLAPALQDVTWRWMAVPFHLCLIPFLNALASCICLGTLLPHRRWLKAVLYVGIIVAGFGIDWIVVHRGPWRSGAANEVLTPSNRILFSIDFFTNLPWLNAIPIAVIAGHDLLGGTMAGKRKWILTGACVAVMAAFAFFYVSLHQEWNASPGSRWMLFERRVRDPYRWLNYRARQAAIDRLVDRSDPNYRTMYAGAGRVRENSGRDWRAINETELHVERQFRTLWQLSEYSGPVFEGFLYGTFVPAGRGFVSCYHYPPYAPYVSTNVPTLKLMGVRYVISYDRPLDSPDLLLRGEADSEPFPPSRRTPDHTDSGRMYIYEVTEPLGVAFLAKTSHAVTRREAWNCIYEKKDFPWFRGEAWIEDGPEVRAGDPGEPAGSARVVSQTSTRSVIEVNAPGRRFLVVSLLFRPFWRALIDGQRTHLYRAYGGFLCVDVPAGKHVVTLRYLPFDVYLGVFLTCLAMTMPWAGLRRVF